MDGHCDCGSVTITIPALPKSINACSCEYCRRVGAHWGYFPRGSATVTGHTAAYRRGSKTVDFHRCTACGTITHWIDPNGRVPHMGVHMMNFDPAALIGVPVADEN